MNHTRHIIILFCLLLLATSAALAADLVRSNPAQAQEGTSIPLAFAGRGLDIGERIIVSEQLPPGATLVNWTLSGLSETAPFSTDGKTLLWQLNVTGASPSISYTVLLPNGTQATFDAVYATSTQEHGRLTATIALAPAPLPPAAQPAMPAGPMPRVESPAPAADAAKWPFLLVAIFLACLALVYVIETSSRHIIRRPFGHHSIAFGLHFARRAGSSLVLFSQTAVRAVSAMMRSTQGVLLHPRTPVPQQAPPAPAASAPVAPCTATAPEPSPEHRAWSSPLFH